MQTRENDRQRGHGRVWDMVLSDYRKAEFNLKLHVNALLYGLEIAIVLNKIGVGLADQ